MASNTSHPRELETILSALDPKLVQKWLERLKRGFLHATILKLFGTPDKENTFPVLTGSAISKMIHDQSLNHWKPSPGSLYPILNEMKRDKLIARQRSNDKKAKCFQITQTGLAILTLIRQSSLLFYQQDETFDPKMSREALQEAFFQKYENKSISDLISIQEFYLRMANIAGELIARKDQAGKNHPPG